MKYINSKGEYPRHIGDIQLEYPSYKQGDELPDGWIKVEDAERPVAGENEIVFEDAPVEIDGVMTQNWVVRDMTAKEIERRDAPETAKAKLMALGLSEVEIQALVRGLI